ncbi:MAG: ATP-dependent ligase clustered with Ku protein LigD, partial [Amycolatopsis sp.]|nr:ATP-dependent ligase clustered with Ku protein LigD [Amycolatopsis sp.]
LGAGVRVRQPERTSAYDKPLAEQFAAETPDLVVSKMAKALREGKVFVDWSQNNPSKNTVAPYSLRGREHPTVSTPVTWNEVRQYRRPASHLPRPGNSSEPCTEVDLRLPRQPRASGQGTPVGYSEHRLDPSRHAGHVDLRSTCGWKAPGAVGRHHRT